MKKIILMMLCAIVLNGCSQDTGCGECPKLSPVSPDYCRYGLLVEGGLDSCGCALPPACESKQKYCGTCPQLTPPGADFCKDGKITPGGEDECGCVLPPNCESIEYHCSDCKELIPPGPDFCKEGKITPGGFDGCGCALPPTCEEPCGECPQYMPPSPEFCKDGILVSGDIDRCGCNLPPRCEQEHKCTSADKAVEFCPDEDRPVCGWFGQDIKCIRYPCATFFQEPMRSMPGRISCILDRRRMP